MKTPNAQNRLRLAGRRAGDTQAASLAHEISNPVEALVNLLFLLEGEPGLSEAGRKRVHLAEEETDRISMIVHRSMGTRRDDTPVWTSLTDLVASVIDFYRSRLEEKGISISTRFCRKASLNADAGLLRQAFTSLLLNAVDAMPKGGKLQARVATIQGWNGKKRPKLRITFADNGSGIEKRDLPRILEPYFTTKESVGNGIGLSLVKTAVQKHGGSLRVRSSTKPGHSGSVFSIFLPAA